MMHLNGHIAKETKLWCGWLPVFLGRFVIRLEALLFCSLKLVAVVKKISGTF